MHEHEQKWINKKLKKSEKCEIKIISPRLHKTVFLCQGQVHGFGNLWKRQRNEII